MTGTTKVMAINLPVNTYSKVMRIAKENKTTPSEVVYQALQQIIEKPKEARG